MQNTISDELDHGPADPLLPARPAPPFYDAGRGAWILSRYGHVITALRERRLALRDEHASKRSETLAALSAPKLAQWQEQMETSALRLIGRLPENGPVEIVAEFARPWSLETAVMVTGADPADADRLEVLAREASEATANPSDSLLRQAADAANAELESYFKNAAIPMSGPAFVALSQTLPCFLANAWLALLRHPAELRRVREQPELISKAVEELLRYAGLARKISRHAKDSFKLQGLAITAGQRTILMLASANRDPEQFPDPDRLDVTRSAAGHVAFGAGPHSCAGSSLIRMAAGVATSAVVPKLAAAEANRPVEWQGGSGFLWASSLNVLLGRATG
jgi:cytochrome P450